MTAKSRYNNTIKITILLVASVIFSILISLSTNAARVTFIDGWGCNGFVHGQIQDTIAYTAPTGQTSISFTNIGWKVIHVELYKDSNFGGSHFGRNDNGCLDLSGDYGPWKNNIRSVVVTYWAADDTPEACANAGRVWFGQGNGDVQTIDRIGTGTNKNCCDGYPDYDTMASGNSLCDSGTYRVCDSNSVGKTYGIYACTAMAGWVNLLAPQEQYSKSCALAVKGDSNADATSFFLGAQNTAYPTVENRCCGNEAGQTYQTTLGQTKIPLVPLYTHGSQSTYDYMTTTGKVLPGYGTTQFLGYIFSPDYPQPAGTVKLFLAGHGGTSSIGCTKDTITVTESMLNNQGAFIGGPGIYANYGLLGYVYANYQPGTTRDLFFMRSTPGLNSNTEFSTFTANPGNYYWPTTPPYTMGYLFNPGGLQPEHTVPLYRAGNLGTCDYLTTTGRIIPGYGLTRVEGYVFNPEATSNDPNIKQLYISYHRLAGSTYYTPTSGTLSCDSSVPAGQRPDSDYLTTFYPPSSTDQYSVLNQCYITPQFIGYMSTTTRAGTTPLLLQGSQTTPDYRTSAQGLAGYSYYGGGYDAATIGHIFTTDTYTYPNPITVTTPSTDLGYVNASGNYLCNNVNNLWLWQRATLGTPFTINLVGNRHDTISNSQKWFSCAASNPSLTNPILTYKTLYEAQSGCSGINPPGCGGFTDIGVTSSPSPGQQPGTSNDNVVAIEGFLSGVSSVSLQQQASSATATQPSGSQASIQINPSSGYGTLDSQIQITGLSGFKGAKIKQNSINLTRTGVVKTAVHPEIQITSGSFEEETISLPVLTSGTYNIQIKTYNLDNSENTTYTFGNMYQVQAPVQPSVVDAQRFLCYPKPGYGVIQECAGYNLANAKNPQSDKVKRAGEVSGNIQEYRGSSTSNNVRRLLLYISRPTGSTFPSTGINTFNLLNGNYYPLTITDWTSYDNLEMDYYTTTKYLTLRIYNTPYSDANINTQIAEIPLINETVDDKELYKWHHLIIDLAKYNLKRTNVKDLYIYIDKNKLDTEKGCTNTACADAYGLGNVNYAAVFGFDRIFLSRDSEQTENRICGWNTIWINDLDSDPVACENTATTHWTENRCCGDDQGRINPVTNGKINETFNDVNAGCFMGNTIRNNTLAANKTLVYFIDSSGPKFRSCNLLETSQTTKLDNLRLQFNPSANDEEDNVKDEALCQNLGSYYCEFDNTWQNATKYNASQPVNELKDNEDLNPNYYDYPSAIDGNVACCPENYCWTGVSSYTIKGGCVAPYSNPKQKPIFKENEPGYPMGYRCNEQGNWSLVSVKKDFNLNDTGYCNDNTQCYANNNCYSSGQWYALGTDRLCYNGNWTTRIKYVAAALLNYSSDAGISDYTLYCDKRENALGLTASPTRDLTLNYNTKNLTQNQPNPRYAQSNQYLGLIYPGAGAQLDTFCGSVPCTNNFCVLKYKVALSGSTKVIVATPLNKPFNATTYPLQEMFGFTGDVQNIPSGTNIAKIFESDESGTLFYVKDMQVIFYTINSGINPPLEEVNFGESVLLALQHPIQTIGTFIKGLTASQTKYDIFTRVVDFDRLYIAKIGDKNVIGVQETKVNPDTNKLQPFIAINYTGFTEDIVCDAARAYKTPGITSQSLLNCTESENSQYVYSIGQTQESFDQIWSDLTAKTRIT